MHAAARNFAKQAGAILGNDRDEIRTRGSVVVPPQTNRLAMVTFRIEPACHRLRDRNSEYSETMHNCYSIRREGSYHLPRRIIALARGMRVRCSAGLVCILWVQHQREWDAARGRSTTPPPGYSICGAVCADQPSLHRNLRLARRLDHLAAVRYHSVDQAVLLRLFRRKETIAIRVTLDALQRLTRVLGHQRVQLFAQE